MGCEEIYEYINQVNPCSIKMVFLTDGLWSHDIGGGKVIWLFFDRFWDHKFFWKEGIGNNLKSEESSFLNFILLLDHTSS